MRPPSRAAPAEPGVAHEPELPRGAGTYLRSMLGVHAFGAVINISAVIIMADRLTRTAPLTLPQAQLLSRSFTAVAFYSPFIGGVAVGFGHTPGSNALRPFPVAVAALPAVVVRTHRPGP